MRKNKVKKNVFIGRLRSGYREKRIKQWEKLYGIDYTCKYSENKIIPCIYSVLHKIPINIFNITMDWGVYFFIMDCTGTIRLKNIKLVDKKPLKSMRTFKIFIITLNGVTLKEKPKEEIEWTIAHELAHMIQSISRAKNYNDLGCNCKKGDERKADKMIEKWGFSMPERLKKNRERVYKREMNK